MGLFGKRWFRNLFKAVVTAVATGINPLLGALVAAGLEVVINNKSFDADDSIRVQNAITTWTERTFTPYIVIATDILNKTSTGTLQQLINPFKIKHLNLFLKELAVLKVYYDFKQSESKGDDAKIYGYRSEIVEFFIKELSRGYVELVRRALANPNAEFPLVNYREEVIASNTPRIGANIRLDWKRNTVKATYVAFAVTGTAPTEDTIPIDTTPIDDSDIPIDLPDVLPDVIPDVPDLDLPPDTGDDVVIITDPDPTDDSGIVTGGSGSDSEVPVNDLVDPPVTPIKTTKSSIPWIWLAGGLVGYFILKDKKKG